MKKFNLRKKCISLILSLVFVISVFQINAFAAPIQYIIDAPVASVTIYADPTGTFGTHAFISIINHSASSKKVGYYNIAPNEEITLGTWGNKKEHKGIWYNLEEYFICTYGSYSNRTSITIDINSTQLAKINSFVLANDTWSSTNNCASFAAKLWNSLGDVQVDPGTVPTPGGLASSINKISWHQYNRPLPSCSKSKIYYTNGTGKTQVSSSSSSLSGSSSSN